MTDNHQIASSGEARIPAARLMIESSTAFVAQDPYRQGGFYTNDVSSDDEGLKRTLREFCYILNKRKWLICSIVAAIMVIALLSTLMTTPLYTSTVRIQIDRHATHVLEGGNITPTEAFDPEFFKTQYELLQSRSLAERVASATQLSVDPGFGKQRGPSVAVTSGESEHAGRERADRERAVVGTILSNRVVRPLPGSRLVDVSFSDPDPTRAQKVASAFGEAFISFNLDKRFQANAYAKTFLDDQIKQLKLRLEDSEKILLDFAEKEQIVATTDKASIAESNLAAANATLGNIISERIKNEQLWRQAQSATAINLPQILMNKAIEDLRSRRNQLVADYQEKSETFRADYPLMVQITNKIKEIERQLASEANAIKSSLKAAFEASSSQEKEMKERIEALRAEMLDLQKRSVQYNILRREVDTTRTLYEGLLQRFKEVDVAGGSGANNVFIVDKAELPRSPSSPIMSRSLAFALVLGLAAGLAAAYLLEYFDDAIHSPDELERISGLVTLGIIPKIKKPSSVGVELTDPRSLAAESYRSLCTALQFSTATGLPKTLLVTSALPGEGKSSTVFAIGRQFATIGLRVLIVDADLRNASLHRKSGVDNSVGLSNFLIGNCSPIDTIQRTALDNLFVMPSGPLPPNAADLLGGPQLLSLLSVGTEIFDLIVIDGPPIMGMADALLLSNVTTATVFVVDAGQGRIGAVRNAIKRLKLARGPLIGTIMTKFDAKAARYGLGYEYRFERESAQQDQIASPEDKARRSRKTLRDASDAA
jgi:polysaccharide biosynthesis transport protein